MAVKHTHGSLHGKNLGEDEKQKMNFIIKSVQSLLEHVPFLEQIVSVTEENVSDFDTPAYTVNSL